MAKHKLLLLALFVLALTGSALTYVSHLHDEWAASTNVAGHNPRALAPLAETLPPLPEVGLPESVSEEELLLDVKPETAREINEGIPFSDVAITPAAPFLSRLTGLDYERAIACLAIAGLYEAGGEANDQRPVMQVILNRVRHPAFPNSVCGVVFQGSERKTGCQFSFACDGSMARQKHPESSVERTKSLADYMLQTGVEERVGYSTHYHTDWVVPYWSSSLDKLAQVNTHLFFIWKGYWGRETAFKAQPSSSEPVIPQMARHTSADSTDLEEGLIDPSGELTFNYLTGLEGQESQSAIAPIFERPENKTIPVRQISLPPNTSPGSWALRALKMCGDMRECRVVGWADPASAPIHVTPTSLTATPPDFVFVQELRNRVQIPYWDCTKWPKASTSRCLGSAPDRLRLITGR